MSKSVPLLIDGSADPETDSLQEPVDDRHSETATGPAPGPAADTTYRRRRDVRFRLVDREAVVLRQDAGETLVLNEVGSRILELLDKGEPLGKIPEILAAEFDAGPEIIAEDVRFFVDELEGAGILEKAPTSSPTPSSPGTSPSSASPAGASPAGSPPSTPPQGSKTSD